MSFVRPFHAIPQELTCCAFTLLSTKTANVQAGETTAIFGLGAVGLAVVQGAVARKASRVIAIDTNDGKEAWARKMGATDFVNPLKLEGQSIVDKLVEMTDGGLDHTLYALWTLDFSNSPANTLL